VVVHILHLTFPLFPPRRPVHLAREAASWWILQQEESAVFVVSSACAARPFQNPNPDKKTRRERRFVCLAISGREHALSAACALRAVCLSISGNIMCQEQAITPIFSLRGREVAATTARHRQGLHCELQTVACSLLAAKHQPHVCSRSTHSQQAKQWHTPVCSKKLMIMH
jgi:hypothetical protein